MGLRPCQKSLDLITLPGVLVQTYYIVRIRHDPVHLVITKNSLLGRCMIALSSGTLEAIMDRVVGLPVEGGGMINHKRRPVLDLFPALRSQALQILKSLASVLCAQLEQDTLRKRLVELEQQRAARATLVSV